MAVVMVVVCWPRGGRRHVHQSAELDGAFDEQVNRRNIVVLTQNLVPSLEIVLLRPATRGGVRSDAELARTRGVVHVAFIVSRARDALQAF